MIHDTPQAVLDEFDREISGDDPDAMTRLFTSDGQLLFANNEPAIGHSAIRDYWAPIFTANITTDAWMDCPTVDVHGSQAYALCTYAETVRPRAGGPARRLHGRAVFFLRREVAAGWRISVALNSPSRPAEEVP
ncbi:MAG TPA: SgcJ/EcaC family oxidoreductase [Candidatus Limnocylindria bacterium]